MHWYVSICGTLIEYSIILETIHNWLFDHVQFSNRCLLVYEHQLQEISNAWHGSLNFRRYFDVLLFVLEYIEHYFGLLRKKIGDFSLLFKRKYIELSFKVVIFIFSWYKEEEYIGSEYLVAVQSSYVNKGKMTKRQITFDTLKRKLKTYQHYIYRIYNVCRLRCLPMKCWETFFSIDLTYDMYNLYKYSNCFSSFNNRIRMI